MKNPSRIVLIKPYLPFIVIGGIALTTLGGGAMLYWAKRPRPAVIPANKIAGASENAALMHIRGDRDAPVTVEEFGDFQCAPCRLIAGFLDHLVEEYRPRLRIVFRNFPLPIHKHAREAAVAAEAAGLQGRFWEMHDLLYREQPAWSKAADPAELFNSYAGMLKLNLEQFKKEMAGEKATGLVAADVERGRSLGVKTTPTIFINNRELPRDKKTSNGIRAMIDAALQGQPKR